MPTNPSLPMAGDLAIYETFEEGDSCFECRIKPVAVADQCYSFDIMLNEIDKNNLLHFTLTIASDGHWTPDLGSIDRWCVNYLGKIIENNF